MPYTQEDYDTRVNFVAQTCDTRTLRPLLYAYQENLIVAERHDRFSVGVLFALDCLVEANTSEVPRLAALLGRLAALTWSVPDAPWRANFFFFVSYFVEFKSPSVALCQLLTCLCDLSEGLDESEGLASVLESVTTFVSASVLSEPELELSRFGLISSTLQQCRARTGDDYRMWATGSDGHMGGHQAVFLRGKDGKRFVYKPRSLWTDNTFYQLLLY